MKKILLILMLFLSINNVSFAEEISTEKIETLIENYISYRNSNLDYENIKYISELIIYYSYTYNVDPLIVTALLTQESNFNQSAISEAGAIGIGQLMPKTAEAIGVRPEVLSENIQGTCSYLATQIQNFSSTDYPVEYALAAYNSGANSVWKYGGIPPYEETINYVKNIRALYFQLYNTLCKI